ncbi:Aspartate aminotransferase, mitochondrial [Aphanomyces cochlioides]|nr:Aspartate aminotransferase, mitochondrial [Aphanomyces cochlioides]
MLSRCSIALKASRRTFSSKSWLASVPMGPADPILGLTEKFNKDTDPRKVSLGVGAYRDDNGKPYVLPSVREAEERLLKANKNKEYSGIGGTKDFVDLSLKFAYGDDSQALKDGRVVGVQTISGTGGCRLAGEFFSRFLGKGTSIYLPNPTWGNHIPIMKDAGLEVKRYAYFEPASRGLDFSGMLSDLKGAPSKSVFLLHACAHNPTGVDPSAEQWKEISAVMKEKEHVVFFDCAYQGFASGDADRDAAALRQFVEDGHNVVLSQSYAKNFGLYGERVGALSIVCKDAEEAARCESQLKILIRPMYSNPPIHGALLVSTILGDAALKKQWYEECKGMADRIISMRQLLKENIAKVDGSTNEWNHITDQIGMFCYTGLTEPQVERMITKHHIYLTKDGRISMAGVTSKNVEYIAQSIAEVVQHA